MPDETDEPDEWLTVFEAMELMSCSRSLIYELKRNGTFRSKKLGGILMLSADDVRLYHGREKKPGWPKGQPRRGHPGG